MYKLLKFKMKLSYEARKQQKEIADLFYYALEKTLAELRTLAVYKIQKIAALHGFTASENQEGSTPRRTDTEQFFISPILIRDKSAPQQANSEQSKSESSSVS